LSETESTPKHFFRKKALVIGMCKFAIGMWKFAIGMCKFTIVMFKFAIGMCKFTIVMFKFAIGMCKSEVCLVLISSTCELNINWSLFVATNKSIESIYWDWTGRKSNSLNSHQQEAFLLEFMISLISL
jgi:hypothetical protein